MALDNPKMRGGYPKGQGLEKGPGRGANEDLIRRRPAVPPMGNTLAFEQRGTVGPGSNREVDKCGSQGQRGASEREYSNPAMDELDRYYGYGKEQGR